MTSKPLSLRILISRVDSIGDVVLTLPMAGWLKAHFPACKVIFLGRSYTESVVKLSDAVDEFVNYDTFEAEPIRKQVAILKQLRIDHFIHVLPHPKLSLIAMLANIPVRVGTSRRVYHWLTCNKTVKLSRRKSDLHEAQLNLLLLSYLGKDANVPLAQIPQYYCFHKVPQLQPQFKSLLHPDPYKVILHAKSKGSAKEWSLDHYVALAQLLLAKGMQVIVTGTSAEAKALYPLLEVEGITNMVGKMNLEQFIALISQADALVAASTGPLHIAAALNKNAIGLYVPKRPIHPGRWQPVGQNAHYLVHQENCQDCLSGKDCDCVNAITPEDIMVYLEPV